LSLFEKSGKARFSAQSDSGDSRRHNNASGCSWALRADRSLWGQSHPQGERLEQPEDFEDNHDNDNHSNYVKDISIHGSHSYQIARAMVNTYRNLSAIHRKFA
jgi:hypothetical protein